MSHLNATPKDPAANAYITEAEATQYLTENRLYVPEWLALTTDDRENAIIWATMLIDISFDFYGNKRTLEQALRFPRSGLVDRDGNFIDYDTIPVDVKKATAELAFYLSQQDPTRLPSILGQGIKSVTMGPISVEADFTQTKDQIPSYIALLLSPYGVLVAGANAHGMSVLKLQRA